VRAARRAAVALAVAGLALTGCAYFNGMYYANHFAGQAEASERAGRIGEARDRWMQAQMHAESLIARHPDSRWTGDAQLVRGRALVHLEAYSDAVGALQEAARRTTSPARHLEALGLMGRAYLALGMAEAARPMLDTAVDARQPEVRDDALLSRGRLLVALDHPDLARGDLERSRDPRAPYDLAQVDLRLGDTAAAGALYDSLAATKTFPEEAWRAGLDSLAASGAGAHAAQLVDRIAARAALSSGARARVQLDGGFRRLRSADTAGAAAAFQRVMIVAPDSLAGQAASVALIRLAVAAAAADSDLEPLRARLTALARAGGGAGREAHEALRLMARLDTLAAQPTAPDAFWFLRAELLRDSLHAGRLASAAFASMADAYPASPWTPKALVAAIAAGHPAGDSLRALLAHHYGESPYALAALGQAGAGDSAYAALEDSLRRVLAVGGARRAPAGLAPRRPGQVGDVGAVEDEPGARRRPPPAAPAPRPNPQPSGPPRPEPPQ
jgi:tetratricopeptide (TPR) repeat protein